MADIGLKAVMDMAGFTAGINKYNQMVGGASSHTEKSAGIMSKAMSGIGTALKVGAGIAAGGIAALATAAIGGIAAATKWAEKIDGVGDVLGTTAEESSALAVAAQMIGGDVTQLSSQMAILTRGLLDAKGEIGPTGLVLQNMGIAFQDANGKMLPTTDILQSVADKIGNMPDGLEKTQLMMDLFGKSGKDMSDMMGVLANGGMEAMNQKAKDLGLSMSDEAANGAIQFGKSMNEVKMMGQGLMVTIGNELLPVLQPLIQDFMALAQQALPYVKKGLDFLIPILQDLIRLIKEGKWNELGEKIADGIKKLWDIVTNWFKSVDWAELGRIIYTTVRDWIVKFGWPWLKGAFVDVKDAIVAWFKSVDWPETGRVIFTTLKTWITQSAWPWLKNAFVDVKDAIVAWFKTVDWGELGRILLEGVKKVIELAWDLTKGIGKALVDLGGKIIKWAQGYDWSALGRAVLDAIISAITSGAGAIWNAILAALGGGSEYDSNYGGGGGAMEKNKKRKQGDPDFGGPSFGGQGFASALASMARQLMGVVGGASMTGAFTSFAGAILGRFQSKVLTPLEDRSSDIIDEQEQIKRIMEGDIPINVRHALAQRLTDLELEQAEIDKKLNIEKERELELQKQLNDLSFLQAQMDFVSFLRENELDIADILGDLQLGLDLDLPAFMDAITAALATLVAGLNSELGGGGPAEIPTTFGGQSFGKPAGGGMQVYNNNQVVLNMNVALNNGMDTEQFRVFVLDTVSGAIA